MIFSYKRLISGSVVFVMMTLLIFAPPEGAAQSPSYSLPETIDLHSSYLFFFHNYYVEMNGPDKECKYHELLKAFAKENLVVVSELRRGYPSPGEYAKEISNTILQLLEKGVAPENIVIGGHSKGGVIALQVSSLLQRSEIKYFILAGCNIASLTSEYPTPSLIKGNFLSLYADSDKIAGSCNAILSTKHQGLSNKEIVLDSSEGHRLFFQPQDIWLAPVFSHIVQ